MKQLYLILLCGWLIRIIDYFFQDPRFNKDFFICSFIALFLYAIPPLGLYFLLVDLFCIIRFFCRQLRQHLRQIKDNNPFKYDYKKETKEECAKRLNFVTEERVEYFAKKLIKVKFH